MFSFEFYILTDRLRTKPQRSSGVDKSCTLRINWLREQGCGVVLVIEDLQAIGGQLQPSAISDETSQNVAW
jgi:hypothetical protein